MIYKYNKYSVEVTENVLNSLAQFKQIGNKFEQGGILLGNVFDNRIVISKISIPTIFDKSSRYGFIRDKKSAQLFIDYEFINSGNRTIYLGEWHTHPEDYPSPSNQDIKMMKKQYKENIINEKFILMIIVGIRENYISIFDRHQLIDLKE